MGKFIEFARATQDPGQDLRGAAFNSTEMPIRENAAQSIPIALRIHVASKSKSALAMGVAWILNHSAASGWGMGGSVGKGWDGSMKTRLISSN